MLPEAIQKKYYYEVEITKNKNKFSLNLRNFTDFPTEYEGTSSDSVSLINTEKIKQFYFKNNTSKDTLNNSFDFYQLEGFDAKMTEVIDFGYEIIYFLKEDGTYGIKYLGNFLNKSNLNLEYTEYKDFEEYQNLQFIEYKNNFYKMKKDDLYKLFPLQKEFRYKKLDNFQGNFARFELPNGQKGWLTLDGKEYLDD